MRGISRSGMPSAPATALRSLASGLRDRCPSRRRARAARRPTASRTARSACTCRAPRTAARSAAARGTAATRPAPRAAGTGPSRGRTPSTAARRDSTRSADVSWSSSARTSRAPPRSCACSAAPRAARRGPSPPSTGAAQTSSAPLGAGGCGCAASTSLWKSWLPGSFAPTQIDLAEIRRLVADRVEHGFVRAVGDRDDRARVQHVVLDVVGRRELGDRHRDRAGVDRAEDRGGRLERVAHQDQHALAALELEAAQRAPTVAPTSIGELVERPRAIAFAQRDARTRAIRERAVDQPSRQVPDHRRARVNRSRSTRRREQKEVVRFLGRCASSAAASAAGSCARPPAPRRARRRRRCARRSSTSCPTSTGSTSSTCSPARARSGSKRFHAAPRTRRSVETAKPALAAVRGNLAELGARRPRDRRRR